jgi:hypothetical protein
VNNHYNIGWERLLRIEEGMDIELLDELFCKKGTTPGLITQQLQGVDITIFFSTK